jgi:hypothetical protein
MAVEYLEVLGAYGAIVSRHPQTTGLLMNLYNSYKELATTIEKAHGEYEHAAQSATGALDKAGILMQVAALHPDVVKFLVTVLTACQTRVPDLIQILNEFQAASAEAYKS